MALIFDSVNNRLDSTSGTVTVAAKFNVGSEVDPNAWDSGYKSYLGSKAIIGGPSSARLTLTNASTAEMQMQWNPSAASYLINYTNQDLNLGAHSTTHLKLKASTVIEAMGKLLTPASTTGTAGLNLPHGTAPSAPGDGDVWTTTAGMYARINGATVGPLGAGGGTPGGSDTQVQFNDGGALGGDADFTWSKTTNIMTLNDGKIRLNSSGGFELSYGTNTSAVYSYAQYNFNIGAVGSGAYTGTAGTLTIAAGTGTVAGGALNIYAGSGSTNGNGGSTTISSGIGVGTGVGGAFSIVAGNGGPTNAAGGSVTITGGTGGGSGAGGNVTISTGVSASGTAGTLSLRTGTTASTTRLSINPAGNVAISAPASGNALSVTGFASGSVPIADFLLSHNDKSQVRIYNATNSSGAWAELSVQSTSGVFLLSNYQTGGCVLDVSSQALIIRTGAAQSISLFTNNTSRLVVSGTGAVTINTPTSGTPLTVNGGKTVLAATASGYASLNLPHGTAPSSPADGDVWTTTGGLFARVNGTTLDFAPKASPTFTGTTTVADLVISGSSIPQNSQSADYTLVAADANKHVLHPAADTTARTFTIPANSSVPYAIGTAITFINQNSAGVVTIAITTDTMRLAGAGTTGSRTLAANGVATALKITSTEWIISGTGLT